MKKIIFAFVVLIAGLISAQQISKDLYAITEQQAQFPDGGVQNFRILVADHFRERKVIGKGKESCEIVFVIDRDGSITDIKAMGTNESFNREAIRAISKIKTKWIPAKINGIPVRYRFRIPLNLDFN